MLTQMLRQRVDANPEATALVYGAARLSYAALYANVLETSAQLRAMGIREGDCVALFLPNCPAFVIAFHAIAHAHAIALPLNTAFKDQELTFYLRESNTTTIMTDQPHAEACRALVVQLDADIRLVIVDAEAAAIPPQPSVTDEQADAYQGPVLYQYSSGSTGRPKRVCRTQLNLVREADNFVTTAQLSPSHTILCAVPLFHAHGLGNCLLAAARAGSKLVILEPALQHGQPLDVPFASRTARVLELIQRERIVVFPGVPFMFSALADAPDVDRWDLSTLELCISAGNFLAQDIFSRFKQRFGLPVRQLYGCTECGSITLNLASAEDVVPTSVGRPMRTIEVKIVDEAGDERACGEIGEIAVNSPAMCQEYVNMPELSQRAFRDGFYFTGDLGRTDRDGVLTITGRKKILIDTGGHKVDPIELEDVLSAHPQIAEAVVVGVKRPYVGEIIKAVIVRQGMCTEQEIVAYCQQRLAEFKIPRIIEFRDAIPKSALGKILRKDLVSDDDLTDGRSEPAHVRESILALATSAQQIAALEQHIGTQLGLLLNMTSDTIRSDRPFGDFGLSSITALELRGRLEASLDVELPATMVWTYPTVSALSRHIAQRMSGTPSPTQAPSEGVADDLAALEQLSDADVQDLLSAQVDALWADDPLLSGAAADLTADLTAIEQLSEDQVQQLLAAQLDTENPGDE